MVKIGRNLFSQILVAKFEFQKVSAKLQIYVKSVIGPFSKLRQRRLN